MVFSVYYSANDEQVRMPIAVPNDMTKAQAERFAQVGIDDYNADRRPGMPLHTFIAVEGEFIEEALPEDKPDEVSVSRKKVKK